MRPTPPATAKDHTLTIGVLSSVAFMSLSIAGACALITGSEPVQPGARVATAMAPPMDGPQSSDVLASAAPKSGQDDQGSRPAAAAAVAVDPPGRLSGGTRPTVVTPRPVSSPTAPLARLRMVARRLFKRNGVTDHGAVLPVPARADPQQAAAASPRVAQSREPPAAGLITPSSLRRLSAALNLTAEQRALYGPLERQLLLIGAEQTALARAGQDPKDAFSIGTMLSMYGVAQPFLNALREDQKARVRAEARIMGFGYAASQI